MNHPLYKIILGDLINPVNDKKSFLIRNGAIVLKRGLAKEGGKVVYKIEELGHEKIILKKYNNKKSIEIDRQIGQLVMPSFFDMHFHWVQDDVRLRPKKYLFEWLSKYTWPHEAKFENITYSKTKAKRFRQELLRMGTLGGACYGTIHKHTVDHALKYFIGDFVVGNVLMTMNSPKYLSQQKLEAIKLVQRQSKKYRQQYVVTPRFAVTTDPLVMKEASKIAKKNNSFIQTHLCETGGEIEYVLQIYRNLEKFERVKSYTEVYQKCGILGPRTIVGHVIHLIPQELEILKKTRTNVAHCPTSNAPKRELGLGSGLFNFRRIEKAGINWALASDIGGGPFLSMFDVMRSFVFQNRRAKINQANYCKALYHSTLAGAKMLRLDKTHGNLDAGKYANFITVETPKRQKGETVETVLKKIIEKNAKKREKYQNIVQKTFYKGHLVYCQ